jgi:uncharacterized protein (TIGR02001 family)
MKKGIKKIYCLLVTALVLSAPVVSAEEGDSPHEFSANVALTTDYRFRGVSQTTEDPAIQGGFDYSYTPIGFYAGVWASNIDFAESGVSDTADLEIDFYGGFAGELGGTGIGWDIGGLYYAYPGSDTSPALTDDYDYFEVYGSLSYDFGTFNVGGGLNYSPDYFFESGDATYIYGDVGVPLPFGGLNLSGHVGHQWIDDNAQIVLPDYTDWKIGVSKDIGKFTFDVSYIDTDIEDSECFGGGPVFGDLCDATAIFTISASF